VIATMSRIRVLIVDDAVVMRRLLTEVLQRDPRIEVVGAAPHGRLALQRLTQVNPDLVTLDVEMPEMDGLATLRELRRVRPNLPVIMLSAATRRGAAATLDSLAAGANDYVAKPGDSGGLEASIAWLAHELLPKVHALCPPQSPPPSPSPPVAPPRAAAAPLPPPRPAAFDLVCLATSTGGPNALAELCRGFSQPLPIPFAIVQHMPPMFTRLLAERLDSLPTHLRCHEAAEGELMQPGHAYLAPGGHHLAVTRRPDGRFVCHLNDDPPENSCRPAADVLFRSAAATGAHVLGVVMTGMGHDGLRGCADLVARGGEVLAQDRATSVVWGMPGAVAQARLARALLPLPQLAPAIEHRVLARVPAVP
jgi:two-component system chemotaxis response regulator CheB